MSSELLSADHGYSVPRPLSRSCRLNPEHGRIFNLFSESRWSTLSNSKHQFRSAKSRYSTLMLFEMILFLSGRLTIRTRPTAAGFGLHRACTSERLPIV